MAAAGAHHRPMTRWLNTSGSFLSVQPGQVRSALLADKGWQVSEKRVKKLLAEARAAVANLERGIVEMKQANFVGG